MQITSLEELSKRELLIKYPITKDFFMNINLPMLNENIPFYEALREIKEEYLEEFGLDRFRVMEQLQLFLEILNKPENLTTEVSSITILGGINKIGEKEEVSCKICSGEMVSIVGPTGSGKSRLLADIECMAQGDTPTKRRILINEKEVMEEERFSMDGKLVAQLSQNMNFIMDLSVLEFLEMHARSRFCQDVPKVVKTCYECANELAGEKFSGDTKVTQLSGGQSRALMIADTAYMSTSPIILIDEIENAGIDRKQAVSLLTRSEKIILMSTHDPLLALRARKRIVIKNGGIDKILITSEEEKNKLSAIEELDQTLMKIRSALRSGNQIDESIIASKIVS